MTAKILCIEDEGDIREDIVEELQDAGYTVFEAHNGKAGLEAVLRHKPDLVLSDISMPEMNGFEFLRSLRTDHPELAELPVMFLSALANREDVIEGKKLGVDDYLTKPIDFEMLLATVESRLSQVQRMRERKDQQMVKLYNALTEEDDQERQIENEVTPADSLKKLLIATVVNDEVDLGDMQRLLAKKGHTLMQLDSGQGLMDLLGEQTPNLVLISLHTTDLAAPTVMKLIADSTHDKVQTILLIPSEFAKRVDFEEMANFDDAVVMPQDRMKLLDKIDEVSKLPA